jgi:D-alanine-D-alanine ligase
VTPNINTVILFGGTSSERRVSVASAQHLHAIIPEARLWFINLEGQVMEVSGTDLLTHQNPYDSDFVPVHSKKVANTVEASLDQLAASVVYIGLHGGDGENGWLQTRLEAREIPFTASGAGASQLAMHKSKSKDKVRKHGLLTAKEYLFCPAQSEIEDLLVFQLGVGRLVLKPACDGSSEGLTFISDQAACQQWFDENRASTFPWLAEEELIGRELTVGVLMQNGALKALPPSEVVLEKNAHFDFNAKYLGVGNREITPAELTDEETKQAQAVALTAHKILGCFGYTRTDMIMTENGIYYLETNTLPGMTKASFIPQQLRAAGIDLKDFVEGQIKLATQRYSAK